MSIQCKDCPYFWGKNCHYAWNDGYAPCELSEREAEEEPEHDERD